MYAKSYTHPRLGSCSSLAGAGALASPVSQHLVTPVCRAAPPLPPAYSSRCSSSILAPSSSCSSRRDLVAAAAAGKASGAGSSRKAGKKHKGSSKHSKSSAASGSSSKSEDPLGGNNILSAEGLGDTADPDLLQLLQEEVEEEVAQAAAAVAAAVAADSATVATARRWRQSQRALVLDQSYRPINIINWFKAVVMDMAGKVDVLDYYPDAYAYSAREAHPLPAVLRARIFVNPGELHVVALNRKNIMLRDKHCCQYCGSRADLTLDHVIPVSAGGGNSWENLVTACMRCNQRKGNKSLKQLGWRLKVPPKEPNAWELGTIGLAVGPGDVLNPPEQWAPYLQPYQERMNKRRPAVAAAATAGAAASVATSG